MKNKNPEPAAALVLFLKKDEHIIINVVKLGAYVNIKKKYKENSVLFMIEAVPPDMTGIFNLKQIDMIIIEGISIRNIFIYQLSQ